MSPYRDDTAYDVSPTISKRLSKLAGPDGIVILDDLFSRLAFGCVSVPAASFRVAHENELECVRRLVRLSFIAQIHDETEVYRLELMSLAIISDNRARRILLLSDAVLRHIAARYRQDPDNRNNQVTVGEIVDTIGQPEAEVVESLRYLLSTPAVSARSSSFPDPPDPYLIATEQALTFHSLEPLITQLSEWAGTSAAMPVSLLDSADQKETRFDKIVSRLKNHRILVWLFVIGLGITLLRGTIGAARDLFQWAKLLWN